MIINTEIKKKIKAHARLEHPKECCGFIVDRDGELLCVQSKNTSFEENKFRTNPKDYLAAIRLGKIVAVYHSHTKGKERFSEFDKFNSINHDLTYVVFNTETNSLAQFSPKHSKFHKYIGREFEIKDKDCWSLVRDFYKTELSIPLINPHRDENWRSYLETLFDEQIWGEGFCEVDDIKKYDCLLFNKGGGKPSSHIAIYLGEDLILHQPARGYSRIESLTNRHKKLINKIIRHKLCMS